MPELESNTLGGNYPSPDRVREAAEDVPDPEIPSLTCGDLGVIRDVRVKGGKASIDVAPTYMGCPATEFIHAEVASAVRSLGFEEVEVHTVRHPPWSSDWISPRGRARLLEAGIAPPAERSPDHRTPAGLQLFSPPAPVACPRCASLDTVRISEHGSTPCKSMHRCNACREPFEHFKCH